MAAKKTVKKVVLAYSGGLDTSICVPWLRETYGCEVICFTADIGQLGDLEELEEKALNSGASQVIVRDLKEEFASEYLFRMLRAGAVYEQKYLLGTAISRPIIAKHQVEIATHLNADALAHGGTGLGNDQVRFELAYMALDPRFRVIAPWREWDIRSRVEAIQYAEAHNIPVPANLSTRYTRDHNLWHLSHEGGPLEEAWDEPEEPMYLLSASPSEAPEEPAYIEIEFEAGTPAAIDGMKMAPAALLTHLNTLGSVHAIGRMDVIENRLIGLKSHGVYETPGGTILFHALRELESLVLDKASLYHMTQAGVTYGQLIYDGCWFSPLREALDAFTDNLLQTATGKVSLKLYKGNIIPVGRRSPFSLYREDLAAYGKEDIYDQSLAEGSIYQMGLASKVRALNRLTLEGNNIPKPDFSSFKRD